MTTIRAAMLAAGHQVAANGPIDTAALTSSNVYLIGEPTVTPTAVELALLRQFLSIGGMILVFGDTGIDLPTYNNLLAGIGSTVAFTTTTIGTTSALPDGKFTLSPWKISGSTLSVSSGNGTAGGTLIDNNYVRFEQIGAGYVVVFGDRIDHDDVISDTNIKLLLNLVAFATTLTNPNPVVVTAGPGLPIPAVSQLGLLLAALALAGVGAARLASPRR